MRVALFTSGRFHLCDVAREFIGLGLDVQLYSLVSPRRALAFGVPRRSVNWLAPLVIPSLIRWKLTRNHQRKRQLMEQMTVKLDRVAARSLKKCDVFIGMSGMSNVVGRLAKEKFGAQIRIQRCSRHIQSQAEILREVPNAEQVSEFDVARELADYNAADVIDVPAEHCRESFLERGFESTRIFCNPFGVDLNCFAPTQVKASAPTIIMVGTWCFRKGCDLLMEAWRKLPGVKLIHVGPVGDYPLPSDPGFTHVDAVPQHELPRYYELAHVMCLASREEGLAFVQPQALACGLKLVCTDRTGGADLKSLISDSSAITVVPCNDAESLRIGLEKALNASLSGNDKRRLLEDVGKQQLSWRSYAERYISSISSLS